MKPIRPKTLILVLSLGSILSLIGTLSALIRMHRVEKRIEAVEVAKP